MTQTTIATIADELYRLSLAFPNFERNADRAKLWLGVLQNVPAEYVRAAVNEYISTDTKWPPAPGQILAIARELREEHARQKHGVKLGHSTVYGRIEEQKPPIDPEKRKQIVAMLNEKAEKAAKASKPELPRRSYEPQPDQQTDQSDALTRLKAAAEFHRRRASKGGDGE